MRIVVVGGVAGGMSFAARARRLDEQAEIIVLERGAHVSYANCGLPYFVGGEIIEKSSLLVQTPESLKASLNLDIRLHQDVVGVDVDAREVIVSTLGGPGRISYDALVLAPGGLASPPPRGGADSARVRTLRTIEDAVALREGVEAGARRAVVLGAGFIGVEASEALALQGLETTLVGSAVHAMPHLDDEQAWPVTQELRRLGITLQMGVAAQEIRPGLESDTVVLSDGTLVEADLIVLATGVRPDVAPFEAAGIQCERGGIVVDEHGRTSVDGVWAVGDATISTDLVTGIRRPVALAGPANRAGRLIADHILRPGTARPIPRPVGTSIVRVGDLAVATTGANRATLDASDIEFTTIQLHPNQHAGYFPGAAPIHLGVHVRASDGLILGAQAVGVDGVDKRIDVLATAIRAQMAVADLIDLDLAYSPPYGQAKDPITLAGMLGANVLDGTVTLWDARDLEQMRTTALLLDVRTAAEIATGMVPEALHVPHTELRDRLEEVREAAAGRPVRVMCASGVRSAIAHRVLVQAGLESASLSGGMLTLRAVLAEQGEDILAPGVAKERAYV